MATSSTNDGATEADRITTPSSITNSAIQTSTAAANSSPSDQAATPPIQSPAVIQSQATVSPAQIVVSLLSSSNTHSANASTSIPSTTASMLPRSTASNTAASSSTPPSSSSSGAATPTTRQYATTNSSHLASPARASSSLAQYHTQIATRGRRISQHNPTSRSRFTSAAPPMASTDNSNTVPSIFGYYSHDASAVNPANPTNASTQPDYGPRWRVVQPSNQPAASRSTGPVRIDRSFLPSPNSSPRVGSLSFYPHAAHSRPSWDNSTTLGTAYRPTQSQQDHTAAAYSTSTSNSTDSSFLSSSLPAPQPTFEETTTISFTWTIRDLHLLREEVELTPPPSEGGRSVSAGAGRSDVWTNQPVFGDNKWKLELVRTTRPLSDQEQDAPSNLHSDVQDQAMSASGSSVEPIAVQGSSSSNTDAANSPRNTITILSVYLTALVLDYTHANVEIPSSIMIGLRPLRVAVGRRGAENAGYLWRRFYDYTFQKEADLFTSHDLPSVSEMLQDVNVARDDAIALTIQLGLGPGHTRGRSGQLDDNAVTRTPVEVDGHHLVPRAVINSLGGLLDDANTGDVRIIVRERGIMLPSDSASMSDDGQLGTTLTETHRRVVPYPIGSSCPTPSGEPIDIEADPLNSIGDDPDRIFVRDRVLWAHASVLKSRSDYFQTMLASDFSEGIGRSFGADSHGSAAGRNVRTLRIPDADFVTTYWFLRYLYTDDIQFAGKEDVRSAVLDEEWAKGADLGYLTAGSSSGETGAGGLRGNMLIDWTPISQLKAFDDLEMEETQASRANLGYSMSCGQPSSVDRHEVSGSFVLQGSLLRTAAPKSNATTSGSLRQRTSLGGLGNASSSVNPSSSASTTISAPTSPSVSAAPPTTTTTTTTAAAATTSNKHHTTDETWPTTPLSAQATQSSCFDPHLHPTSHPGPASALSIFKLSHRYHMQDLSRLASLHIIATLTPHSAFPMLLATSMYDELHMRIKTFVYQHWHLVSHTKQFERCCDEVSVGLWGSDAGKTVRAFVRSLVSPLRAVQG